MFQAGLPSRQGSCKSVTYCEDLHAESLNSKTFMTSPLNLCQLPSLPSPYTPGPYLLDAPIDPLDILEELSTPSSSGGLIVIEVSPLVLLSPVPTPNHIPELAHLSHCLFSSLCSCLSQDSYTLVPLFPARSLPFLVSQESISKHLFSSQSSVSCLYSVSCLSAISCLFLFRPVPNFFSTQNFSLRLLLLPDSFPLL